MLKKKKEHTFWIHHSFSQTFSPQFDSLIFSLALSLVVLFLLVLFVLLGLLLLLLALLLLLLLLWGWGGGGELVPLRLGLTPRVDHKLLVVLEGGEPVHLLLHTATNP